jgi:hypothetical protein
MLAELAAANAAFAIIKKTIQNGKDLHDTGNAAYAYFNSKTKIQKNFTKKGKRQDLEEFFALEKLREQEEQLKELMIYAGRPGLWDDWLKFQSDAKKQRDHEELMRRKAIIARNEQIKQLAVILAASLFGVTLVVGSLFIFIAV